MLIGLWLKGLLARRSARMLGAAAGVMVAVALLASIGAYVEASAATMTSRAIAEVPVDWQVQLVPGADVTAVTAALGAACPYEAIAAVGYADAAGLSATTGGTIADAGLRQGPRRGSGLPPAVSSRSRLLAGSLDGVLIAQQKPPTCTWCLATASSSSVPGLTRLSPGAGVVDLPQADSLFQAVGVPANAAPQAPPDNVLLLPSDQWHRLFDPQANVRPDSVRTQLHVRLVHDLAADPRRPTPR